MYRATWKEQVVVEIPGQRLIEDCPVYAPEAREDEATVALRARCPDPGSRVPGPADVLLTLLDHPAIASKRWVYEQYDSTVRSEEHTSELQSHSDLVCRLLLEKKNSR